MELAHKSQFAFEPSASIDLNGTGDRYVTPTEWAINLGPLMQLSYKRAEVKIKAVLSATGSGTGTITVKAGLDVLQSFEIDNALSVQHFLAKLPVSTVSADADLTLVVAMTAGAAATMTLDGVVEVETPLVLGSC